MSGSSGTKNVVLAWGAHIATRADWGANASAVAISGSPYHVSLGDVSNNFGRQGDRDMQTAAAAVIFPASITIEKHASPEGSTAFQFTASPSPLSNFSLTDNSASSDPTKAFTGITDFQSYAISETVPSGWSLATITCTVTSPNDGHQTVNNPTVTIDLREGENVTCTFSNDRKQGTLTVIKHVVNNDGGTATASAWSIHVKSGSSEVAGSPKTGKESPGDTYTLSAGTYSVSETGGPNGYTASFSGACDNNGSVTLQAGETKTCTITNDDQAGTLTVIKHVVNNNGGTDTASAWSIHVKSGSSEVAGSPKTGKESPGDTYTLSAGTYSVSETGGPNGYTASFSGACDNNGSVTLQAGETKTCTITNDDQAGTLVVIKHVVNNNGGTKDAADFQMQVTADNPSSATFPGEESPGTSVSVDAGAYSVDEGAHAGYTKSLSAACSGTIANGETKTCTITNDDQAGTLVVIKHVVNNNGGTKDAADFQMQVTADNPSSATFPGAESPGTSVTVDAGAYSVDEGAHAGYTKSLSAACSGTIANGETKTCTITNDDQAGTLVVIKHVVNNNGGTARSRADFHDAGHRRQPELRHLPRRGEPGTSVSVDAGAYSVDEGAHGGYTKSLSAACSAPSPIGETKTCTITNDDQAGTLVVIKHVVNNNGGTKDAADFQMQVTADNPSSATFPGEESPGTSVSVDAGAYSWTRCPRRLHQEPLRRLLGHHRQRRDEDLHDHQRRPGRHARGDQARREQQRRDQGRSRLPDAGHRRQPELRHLPRRGGPGTSVSVDAGAYSVDEGAHAGYTKSLSRRLLGHHRQRRDEDLHDHQRRPGRARSW